MGSPVACGRWGLVAVWTLYAPPGSPHTEPVELCLSHLMGEKEQVSRLKPETSGLASVSTPSHWG